MSKQTSSKRKVTLSLVLSWIFGIFLSFVGIIVVFIDRIPGLILLIMAGVLLPPVTKLINQKLKIHISRNAKMLVIIIGFIAFCVAIVSGSDVSTPQETETQGEEQSQTESEEPEQETNPNQTEAERMVREVLEGDNNLDKPYFRGIQFEGGDGGYIVTVEFNIADNLTDEWRILGMKNLMSEIYTALYKDPKGANKAVVAAYFPMIDKYGNVDDYPVYRTNLVRSIAEKVNWEQDEDWLISKVIPELWSEVDKLSTFFD